MRGSSGAVVTVHGTYVTKLGDRRVGEQGRWLLAHSASSLPRVFDVFDTRYTMETLIEADPTTVNFYDILIALGPIWLQRPCVEFCARNTMLHLKDTVMAYAPDLYPSLVSIVSELEDLVTGGYLHPCAAHGDPTVDNVMHRWTGEIVLIDPLPPRSYAPDLMAVDLGKILQSAAGYEFDRYELPNVKRFTESAYAKIGRLFGGYEQRAAVTFAFIHFLRLLPYIDDKARKRVIHGSMAEIVGLL